MDINIPFYESSSDKLAYVLLSYNEMDLNFILTLTYTVINRYYMLLLVLYIPSIQAIPL